MDFNNGYITILSVMSAVFALHLVLKRDQAAKFQSQRLVREKMSLLELKEEIAHNLAFFDRINDESPFELNRNNNLKSHAVKKYAGDFPLTDDEMVCIENSYRIFNLINSAIESIIDQESPSFQSLTPLIRENRRDVEAALNIIEQALMEF